MLHCLQWYKLVLRTHSVIHSMQQCVQYLVLLYQVVACHVGSGRSTVIPHTDGAYILTAFVG